MLIRKFLGITTLSSREKNEMGCNRARMRLFKEAFSYMGLVIKGLEEKASRDCLKV